MHLKSSALLEVTVFAKEVFLNVLSLELFLVASSIILYTAS